MNANWKSWVLATRPKTLTATLIPVLVGTALAKSTGIPIKGWITVFALLSAFCIQIGTNFINDALDFKKGADTTQRLGPVRVTASGLLCMHQVHTVGLILFGMALLFGIPLVYQGGIPIAILLFVSVILGYAYTGGPFPLAYKGLGDLFVLLFYGFISTSAVYYLQTGQMDLTPLLAGAQIGSLATVLIAINNLRDILEDTTSNKKTLAVRFGETFARYEITVLALLPFVLGIFWIMRGDTLAGLLPMITLPTSIFLVTRIWLTAPGRVYNFFLAISALLHLTFGLLLCLAFWLK